jgi:hypothetical protein
MKLSRFSEPSTWAGFGLVFQVLAQSFGVVKPDLGVIFQALSGGAAGLAVLLREGGGSAK